jgi:hypothetical protein
MMRKFWLAVVVLIAIIHGSTSNASAQAPAVIGQQGILTDSLGNPIASGTFDLAFRIYSQPEGGSSLWTETQTVELEAGLYSVELGSINPIDLPFDTQYWLGIAVNGAEELSPRLTFTAAPYARRANSVDRVDSDALPAGVVMPEAINSDDAAAGQVLVASDTGAVGWALVSSGNVAQGGIDYSRISPAGGATGQILTVEGDSVGWSDPEEITGAALPNKSVRSVKLNSTDGSVGLVLAAAGQDSVVWSQVGTSGLADESVTSQKLSPAGGTSGRVLVHRGDSVIWDQAATAGIADRAVTTGKISTNGGAQGQILTVTGDSASWRSPAGIEDGSLDYDKISTNGASAGDVLTAADGDTTAWLPVRVGTSNLVDGAVTVEKISSEGAETGQVLSRTDGGVAWTSVDPEFIPDGSVPVVKLSSGGAANGQQLTFDGSSGSWQAGSSLALPFSGQTTIQDSTSFRITNPIEVSSQDPDPVPDGYAIHGIMSSERGGPSYTAVRGENRGEGGFGIGVWGSHSGSGWGVYGTSPNGNAIYGSSLDGAAGFFDGRVTIIGTLQKSAGSFRIDHPLDPANKYLSHSFVESPDMMNIYNGIATLDGSGSATVQLPEWFDALNRDFRYQLTPIGAPGPNLYISQEIVTNTFSIAGGVPGMRVSWQVTGIRDDAYAREHPIVVEEDKPLEERGRYLNPEAFGLSRGQGVAPQQEDAAQR